MPTDVRKAFGLPVSRHFDLGLRPDLLGRSPEIINNRTGSAERFRTSSGIAASAESFFGQSRGTRIRRVLTGATIAPHLSN
jgi:hypothetical protein